MHSADSYIRAIVHTLRNRTAFKLFGLSHLESLYLFGADRSEVEEFLELVQWPIEDPHSEKYRYFLPIHFPAKVRDFGIVFRCEYLALVSESYCFLWYELLCPDSSILLPVNLFISLWSDQYLAHES